LILDVETGQITDVNPFLIEMLGYTHGEFLGKKLWEIGAFKDLAAARTAFIDLQTKGFIRYEDLPLETKDGRQIDVEFISNVYAVGESQVIQCNIRDITRRSRAERARRKSEEEFRRFFEANLAGNFVSAPDGKLLACNSAFARMFGFASVEEALNLNLASLYADSRAQEAFVDALKSRGQLEQCELELRRSDGKPLYVIASAVGTFNEGGELTQILGYLVDETERRKAEELLRQAQKMDAIGRLAGGIAHDFNNLLGIIMGYSELMRKGVKPDDFQECAEEILKATRRGAALTGQLLAFSRHQVLKPAQLDLNKVVADLSKMLRRLIREDIELVTHLAPELGRVKADQNQMGQVILNLAINAQDAMPQGGHLVIETSNVVLDESYIEEHPTMRPGGYVMLAVSDSGVGMDQATRGRIFEPFFTTKEFGKGAGLGLAIVYGIVKQSDGFISVYSEPGMGTSFKIYLPHVQEEASVVRAEHVPQESFAGRGTILWVEDEDSLRKAGQKYLDSLGYTVLDSRNGIEALEVAERCQGPIHVLVADVVMPKMGGRELTERLRLTRDKLQVIYISGYTSDAIASQGLLEPGLHFLQKPFSLDSLASKIREVTG